MHTYSVDVRDSRRREIIIYDEVHAFEIDASAHQLCANQNPDFALPEAANDIVTLRKKKITVM